MDVRTGSKSWGYSKRPRNWKKIMYQEIDEIIPEIGRGLESEASIDEIEEIEEIEEIIEEIGRGFESEASIEEKPKITARIEKPKITARVSKPVREELPQPLVNPALLDFSFSHI